MAERAVVEAARNALASSMPTGSTLPVRLCLRSLMKVSVIARDFGDRAVQPHRGVDAVRQQIAGDAAAGHGDVEPPQAFAALRQVASRWSSPAGTSRGSGRCARACLRRSAAWQRDGGHAAVVVPDHVGHAGLLDRRRPSPRASAAFAPSGFSHITILPALAAAMAISACVSLGLAMSIRSMSLRSTSLRQSVSIDS